MSDTTEKPPVPPPTIDVEEPVNKADPPPPTESHDELPDPPPPTPAAEEPPEPGKPLFNVALHKLTCSVSLTRRHDGRDH